MIIQCDECQTRFRLADEKVKSKGTKVRCSRCKHVFTVFPAHTPPREDQPDLAATAAERETPSPGDQGESLAENAAPQYEESFQSAPDQPTFASVDAEPGIAHEESGEFDLSDKTLAKDPADPELDVSQTPETEAQAGPLDEFVFDDLQASPEQQESPSDEAALDEGSDADTFFTEDSDAVGDSEVTDGELEFDKDQNTGPDFSFDDESDINWDEDDDDQGSEFDFDEPKFDLDDSGSVSSDKGSGLEFGEIDFSDGDTDVSSSAPDHARSPGTTSPVQSAQEYHVEQPAPGTSVSATSRRSDSDQVAQQETQQKDEKSPSRARGLFLLLILVIAGAAAYLYFVEGIVSKDQLVERYPFLQTYLGDSQSSLTSPRINISVSESLYVKNTEAGQLLVIQGNATNNHPDSRSAITVKGILQNEQGKVLLQQTVFCGNYLPGEKLKSMPFKTIEEAMNNQFGDSLSNMNVASGATIPFTIVFRNLPKGIANINVEYVDSKPGQ
ncbi:MAG: zinc-ribbon domain-containing protein [Deltaproteobacteria bacterium]|jgi:predicted Zn finger-like uncharacterized protein|nr:zinc-ribbon domain-containing protein [Deltaproteobacteria bacterium]